VIRVAYGGYITGGAIYHSQSGASLFTANPGLRVICPSNATDANGLLRTAIRCDDPVLFLEHKHLYRQTYNQRRLSGTRFMIPFGKARSPARVSDVTVVTYGPRFYRALTGRSRRRGARDLDGDPRPSALEPDRLERHCGFGEEDEQGARAHGRLALVGLRAEIAARIGEELYAELDGPVRRLGATDTFVGYAPELEDFILPQSADILKAAEDLARF
jgi:2-oxoisovalerate dehydrogenase E1 component